MTELTPGALGRAILYQSPEDVAPALLLWWGDRPPYPAWCAEWLRRVAAAIDDQLAATKR
jgi:hypothetical protein